MVPHTGCHDAKEEKRKKGRTEGQRDRVTNSLGRTQQEGKDKTQNEEMQTSESHIWEGLVTCHNDQY